jgi:hypothetical protein
MEDTDITWRIGYSHAKLFVGLANKNERAKMRDQRRIIGRGASDQLCLSPPLPPSFIGYVGGRFLLFLLVRPVFL